MRIFSKNQFPGYLPSKLIFIKGLCIFSLQYDLNLNFVKLLLNVSSVLWPAPSTCNFSLDRKTNACNRVAIKKIKFVM